MKNNVYLNELLKLKNNFSIKLITGVRGTGKLKLLGEFVDYLKSNGVDESNIIFMDFENTEHLTDFQELYSYVNKKIENLDYVYLLFHGIQKIRDWEKAINALFLGTPSEIYIADSNEKLLTEKLIQMLPNNCDVLKLYPLSFTEYLKSLSLDLNDLDSPESDMDTLLKNYLCFGGMPIMSKYPMDENVLERLLAGLLYESLLKDVVIKYSIRNPYLLQCIMKFLALNSGKSIKLKCLDDYFVSVGQSVTSFTLDNYLNIINESEIFKKIPRYDLKKSVFVNANECFYCADSGLCNALLDFNSYNETALIKNVVYLELMRQGYDVYSPIIGTMTADFFAVSNEKKLCLQVLPAGEEDSLTKILRPLHKLPDNVDKVVISRNPVRTKKNVKNITVIDFLLNNDWH